MRVYNQNILFGLYDDEEVLLKAVHRAKDDHLEIWDVFSPFPIHGLDEALDLSESRLHVGGFVYGLIGFLTAFLGMTWIFTRDWPVIIGGKPHWAIPAFIPITFEMTVLFSAIGMTITFFVINGQGPGITNPILDERITDDKFCIAFDTEAASDEEKEKMRAFFDATGASEIHEKMI
jgi:hypothetical protein